jgi:anti-sigma B factor antagonist
VDLEFSEASTRGWHVVAIRGELDLHTAPLLRDRIEALTAEEPAFLAIDLTEVPFMDSSALGVIVGALERLREHGGDLALVGVSGSPAKVLSITGVGELIPSIGLASDLPER